MLLQHNCQEQSDTYKREMKSLRTELDQLRVDDPYYVGDATADDKVDDDPLRRQQRGRDWTAVDDPSKVSLDTDISIKSLTTVQPHAGSGVERIDLACISWPDVVKAD